MEDIYAQCKICIDDYFTRDAYLSSLKELNFQSSPGYPFMLESSTIGDWLGFTGFSFDPIKVERLWIMVKQLIDDPNIDCHWKVFIKQEPHKQSKIAIDKWRLIMCPPLDVQILWQMVFSLQNQMEIRESFSLPSQQGLILPGGNWKFYYDQWRSMGLTHGMDMSNWDWSVSDWMVDFDLSFRTRLVYGLQKQQWKTAALKLYENAFKHPRVLFSDGSCYRQLVPGIMKSGCVNTISTNSHLQVMLHIMYSLEHHIQIHPLTRAVGDDRLVAKQHVEDLDWFKKYGVTVKEVNEGIEFVGHRFTSSGPEPLYFAKHVYKLCHSDDDIVPEILDSYLRLYVNTKRYDFWLNVAIKLGLSRQIHSKEYYEFWYHNPFGLSRESLKWIN